MKNLILKVPFFRDFAKLIYFVFVSPFTTFHGSTDYWKRRYMSGENSGAGSYAKFAEFKAEIINSFVKENNVKSIIEYGCGDGNQLRLSEYPAYTGFDVSQDAINICMNIFSEDVTKDFKLMDDYDGRKAELCLSLDVIYHLIEDEVFVIYMDRLFDSSTRFVIIYSSNTDKQAKLQKPHVKHRKFTKWVEQEKNEWNLIRHIPNKYPYSGNDVKGSFADFFIFENNTDKTVDLA